MSRLFKSRHLPYKLFVKLLYGHGSISPVDGGTGPVSASLVYREVDIGSVAKSLRCSNSRVIEALDWLSALGLLSYKIDKKKLTVNVYLPNKDV